MVRAAVLVCLFEGDNGDLRVILIKRASTLSSHAGEVALPGGKREEGDANDVETALREAKEEIGLDASLLQVVTLLHPFVSVRGISVVPVVALLLDRKTYNPVPDPTEVELILDAPLEMFLKDKNRREEELQVRGHRCLLHFFDYETEDEKFVIFALTAAILTRTASVVYQKEPEFVVRSPKLWH
ncbi:nudix hydrolase 22, chloroplastic-like isoform X1 [Punica granatum]|nr:nudix hydrolase 22, chloroplastic-like isoform X1 [Punica granatum]XP_031397399.1 nudix hydrolase 22, chloroplastic-like isoform X1 [Punica granatum]OWM77373.1 hypothetical protein CDL15_Pgr016770 [Punica granatum]